MSYPITLMLRRDIIRLCTLLEEDRSSNKYSETRNRRIDELIMHIKDELESNPPTPPNKKP